jgi:hypothetical protein
MDIYSFFCGVITGLATLQLYYSFKGELND